MARQDVSTDWIRLNGRPVVLELAAKRFDFAFRAMTSAAFAIATSYAALHNGRAFQASSPNYSGPVGNDWANFLVAAKRVIALPHPTSG